MGASSGDRKKQAVLGSMASDSQTASSPELASQVVSELLQFDSRPRSWSACSDRSTGSHGGGTPRNARTLATFPGPVRKSAIRSLRPASIMSSGRSSIGASIGASIGSDISGSLLTASQPRVATTFAGDSHQVEARGKIYTQSHAVSSETKPGAVQSSRRQTLDMIKPLAALNAAGSENDVVASVDKVEGASDAMSLSSTMSKSRLHRRNTASGATVAHVSVESSPAQPSEEKKPSSENKGNVRPSSTYLWSTFSRFSSGGSAIEGGIATPTGKGQASAIDHMKKMEPKENAILDNTQDKITESCEIVDNTEDVDTDTDLHKPKSEEKVNKDGKWMWGWFGAQSSNAAPFPKDSVISSAPAQATAEIATGSESGAKPDAEETLDSKDHNVHQKDNVLLPDLVFDENTTTSNDSNTHGSSKSTGSSTTADESSSSVRSAESSDTVATALQKDNGTLSDHESEQPIYKKLRILGRSAIDSAIEMAPGWARSMLYGGNVADILGQQDNGEGHGHANCTGQKSESVKESMDRGARDLGRIAIIGIHGWFPTRMVQMLAGEPTGRSEKFCLMMRDALKAYLLESHGVNIDESDVSLFPLVGEGKIDDRVDLLLSQILDDAEPGTSDPEPVASMTKESESIFVGNGKAVNAKDMASPSVGKSSPSSKTKASSAAAGSSANARNSHPSSKHSEIVAKLLMPERGQRVDKLKDADTVFVVTHSQGTPVSAIILERLIEMEIIDTTRQRVAMLAMAGISHGPLAHLKDNVVIKYIESEAARELFELMDPSSPQSQRYVAALSTVLHRGVRLICIGSWVDEVVPLYSAILQGVSHQNVYRAVYIDAPHYIDDFLTNLIVFALRLRNMGIYDHDLLIHLSEVVAGSLWGHSGHSTVYGEPSVYKLAIRWLLYSISPAGSAVHVSTSIPTALLGSNAAGGHLAGKCVNVSGPQIHMSYRPFDATKKLNPFYIPWIMRTLWDEPEIRQNEVLRMELQRLVRLFDQWTPDTKVGKELKYRLEPVRAAI
ncbi:hypothetical protein H4217_006324 [Coemansia sp. RSA 1939]|nr:hypothetical protein H4217_006324 [Coemansia sp. RSA 1939]KAJ2608520.1 hypothetical protein EV177_004932 [Coemansia sp. RSA 1804]